MSLPDTLTVGEFLDALDKNGYSWAKNTFWDEADRSCAIGQAARNLGWEVGEPEQHVWVLSNKIREVYDPHFIHGSLVSKNDNPHTTYEEVVKFAHSKLDDFRDNVIDLRS